MTNDRSILRFMACPIVAAALALGCPALAQNGAAPPPRDDSGRRIQPDEPTTLAFKRVTVEQVVPFIVEATGKVVLPQQDILMRPITILNDEPIPRSKALDLVFFALQQNGVGVVETHDLIILRDIGEITRQDVPVIGPGESTLARTDLGAMVQKVFELRNSTAKTLADQVKDTLPDFAKMFIDEESNQLVVMGNVGLVQRVERLVTALDRPGAAALDTETFRLRYADATQIAENINELFNASTSSRTGQGQGGQAQGLANFFQRGGRGGGNEQQQAATTTPGSSLSSNLRVTANTQQNSVTVLAERAVIEQVRDQITNHWDLPLPPEAVIPRIYDLKNSDPVKVRDLLQELFGQSSAAVTTGGGGRGAQAQQPTQGVGRLAGQFSFEAIPESGRLVVVAKSPDHLERIDEIVRELDKPQTVGLPRIIELKHASAEELAEQLNTLLAQEGTIAQIPRQETELSEGATNASPFATDQADTNQDAAATAPGNIAFWWQRARPPTDSAGSGPLVGKVRIVPVWRQNALMIMAPPEYLESVSTLALQLDQPGRQVLISAVIAEISVEDATALGIRWSSSPISPSLADNAIGVGADFTGSQDDFIGSLFNTSVLDVNVDLNVLLQALAQKTAINILSEPRIFTSDNQEADFFDGQDIPFVTDSQVTDTGAITESFDYRAVGIQLRVRPRITVNRDVDLRVNLELSSIVPGETLFGGFIVDRRETTTHLIVRDGQTVVISGILRNEASKIRRKVPFLGDLPLIGALFTSIDDATSATELVAFITPIVVTSGDEMENLNVPYRQRLDVMRQTLTPGGRVEQDPELLEPQLPVEP